MDISAFIRDRAAQITATIGLVTFSLVAKKLTPGGIVAGIVVAVIHMLHPWPAIFWLLIVFFVLGTAVTKAGNEKKLTLTQSATGGSGGEGARTAAQVLANSGVACVLILAHIYILNSTPFISSVVPLTAGVYAPRLQQILPIGILVQYAAVTADTFSSELGILADSEPVLITDPWGPKVPRGTNGGITLDGLLIGGVGSFFSALIYIYLLDKYSPLGDLGGLAISTVELIIVFGALGSVIDSLLGALVQTTVTDKKSGKVIEGHGGQRVKVNVGGSRVQTGWDGLTNNGVNFVMAATTSALAMGFAWVFGMEL